MWFGSNLRMMCLLLLCGMFRLAAEEASGKPAVVTGRVEEPQEAVWQEYARQNPGIRVSEVQAFYQEHAPELLQEWGRYCRELPGQAGSFLQQLVDGYRELLNIKTENPNAYQWQLRRLTGEVKLRRLGSDIKRLSSALEGKTATGEPALTLELHQKKQELKKLLELAFLETQQYQQIEIRRLEAEMNMLKQLFDERGANRETILQERFRSLSGTDW